MSTLLQLPNDVFIHDTYFIVSWPGVIAAGVVLLLIVVAVVWASRRRRP